MKDLKYTKAEIGKVFYAINRDDRINDLQDHNFLFLEITGIAKYRDEILICLSKHSNDQYGPIFFNDNYSRTEIELGKNKLFKIHSINNFSTFNILIKDINSMPSDFINEVNGRIYTEDEMILKKELLELLESEIKSIYSRIENLKEQQKHLQTKINNLK